MRKELFAPLSYDALLNARHAVILHCSGEETHAVAELFRAQGAHVHTEPFPRADILVCGEPQTEDFPFDAMRQISAAAEHVLGHMQAQCSGSLVFLHSPYSDHSVPGQAARGMLSGAICAYMRALAMQYAKYNIRANSIAAPFPANADALMQLLPRSGCAQNLAQAALFLASDMSAFLTGQTLPVNGGGYLIGHNQCWTGK